MALERERDYFESLKADLLHHHEGKYALVIGTTLVGVFDTREQAYRAGVESHGNVAMLIKQVLRNEPIESVPAMTLGLISAHL